LIGLSASKSNLDQRVGMVQGNSKQRMAQLGQMGGEGRGAELRTLKKGGMEEA